MLDKSGLFMYNKNISRKERAKLTMSESLNEKRLGELIMFVGIPASGKSTTAKKYEESGYKVLSSDVIRAQIVENTPIKGEKFFSNHNANVYDFIKKKALIEVKKGVSVVVDATNLNRKKRKVFIRDFRKIGCEVKCVLFITSIEVCSSRNKKREGNAYVPLKEMRKLIKSFECPYYWEGFSEIIPVIDDTRYLFPFEETVDFSQDNPHHNLTLYGHLCSARDYAITNGYPDYLVRVCYYHDVGKFYTKTFENSRGEITEVAHFYGHENFSAYLYLTEFCCGKNLTKEQFDSILYQTNIINFHMRPLNVWSRSENAVEKDISRYGKTFIDDVRALNKADCLAHKE